jgi:hypothetical protein
MPIWVGSPCPSIPGIDQYILAGALPFRAVAPRFFGRALTLTLTLPPRRAINQAPCHRSAGDQTVRSGR